MRNRRHLKIWISTAVLLILLVTLLQLGEHPGKNMSDWRRREDRETEKIQLEENKSYRYVDTLEKILCGEFINPESVTAPSQEFINLGMIIINRNNTTFLSKRFCSNVSKMFESIFVYNYGTPLNLIIETDKKSLMSVSLFMGHLLMYPDNERVIFRSSWMWRRMKSLPLVKVNYVDSDKIIEKNKPFIKSVKACTAQSLYHKTVSEDRYTSDLF